MLRKIILSRGRADTITTHKLLKDFTLVCPESELGQYEKVITDNEIVCIPDEINGLGRVRNWIMDKFEEDILYIDDDISSFGSVCNLKHEKITKPEVIEQILDNMYWNAKESGARVFGLNQTPDPRKYSGTRPFKLHGWLGTVIGVIGKDMKFDVRNKIRVDVDFCLKSLMEDRMIWVENRFCFTCKRNTNRGGSAKNRSENQLKKEKKYLKEKWGKYINFSDGKGTDNVSIRVDRKDKIDYFN